MSVESNTMKLYFLDQFERHRLVASYPYEGVAAQFIMHEELSHEAYKDIMAFLASKNVFKTGYHRVVPYEDDYVSIDVGYHNEFFILSSRKLDK